MALAAQAEQMALAADAEPSSRDAIMSTTRAGIVSSWNPPAVLLYGYLAEDIVGRAADVLWPPEKRAQEAETLQRVLAGGPAERFDAERVCKDGTVAGVSLTVTPIVDEAGTITGVTTVSWKAGERQGVRDQAEGGVESERRDSREAQERFDVMVGTERRDAREAQERFEKQVNAQRRDAREAQELYDIKVDAQRRDSRDAQAKVEAEIESVRRDAWKIQKQFDVRRDGERREALERNEMLQAQLQQAQRLENLGQLAGGIAHDFNNLLAVILNYATFVSEEMDAATESDCGGRWETARGDVTQIKQAAERAAPLTHQLLAFARRAVVRPQVLDLDQVVAGVTEMLRRTLGEHIDVTASSAGGLWPVLADPGQLEQVLMNLAVNARDAMPGGGTLTIETGNVTVDADFIAGGSEARPAGMCGCESATAAAACPPTLSSTHSIHSSPPSRREPAPGSAWPPCTGSSPRPRATSRSTPNPAREPPSASCCRSPRKQPPGLRAVPYQRSPKGETVLVVEDEEALREVSRRIFARNGYHVITAASGPEAIEIVRTYQGDIHLLVTDVVMPQMLGKEVSEQSRRSSLISKCSSCPATLGRFSPLRACSTPTWP